jgi:biopolymer transport protein ExbD
MSRGREARNNRRAAQFAKFRMTELNLIPLVDTFVSIVFFALVTQTAGELTTVVSGVSLPESRVGAAAHKELTLGVGATVTLDGKPLMSIAQAASAASDDPRQPLKIPSLYRALRVTVDSIRTAGNLPAGQSVRTPLAIQGDRTMRYDLLSRFMQTARLAGFSNISLQVNKTEGGAAAPAQGGGG